MFRKKLIIFLMGSIVLGLTGCAGNKESDKGAAETNSIDTTQADEEQETTKKNNGIDLGFGLANNVKKTQIAKDKSSVLEIVYLIHMEIMMLEPEEHDYLKPNEKEITVNENGEIYISDLFDTSNEVGQKVVNNITEELGDDTITFSSDMKKDCVLKIVKLDVSERKIIIQMSSKATATECYVDIKDVHDGVYGGE